MFKNTNHNMMNKNMLNKNMLNKNTNKNANQSSNAGEKHFKRSFPLEKPEEEVRAIMDEYLEKKHFIVSPKYGGQTYRSEKAHMFGFNYLKWKYQDGTFSLEAWVCGTLDIDWNMNAVAGWGYAIINPYKQSLIELIKKLKKTD